MLKPIQFKPRRNLQPQQKPKPTIASPQLQAQRERVEEARKSGAKRSPAAETQAETQVQKSSVGGETTERTHCAYPPIPATESVTVARILKQERPILFKDEKTEEILKEERDERDRVIISLRASGMTYAAIAKEVSLSAPYVHTIVKEYLKEYASSIPNDLAQIRALEQIRLDALTAAAWPSAMQGDLSAIDTQLKIMQRRSKLNGLDAPVQTETQFTGSIDHTGAIGLYPSKQAQLREMEALRNVYSGTNAPALESLNTILARLASPEETPGLPGVQTIEPDMVAVPTPATDL